MTTTVPPWQNAALVAAATDLACDVRELDPDHVRRQIARIPPDTLAGLAIAAAALVDIDQPLSALTRWTTTSAPRCLRGHRLHPGNLVKNGGGRMRCRTCNDLRRQVRSQ